MGSGRGSDALAAARAAARARREAARQLADQARDGTPEPEPDLEPEPPQPPPVPDAVTRADRDGDRPRWPDRALDPARPFDPAELRHRRPREQHVGHGALGAGSPTARPKARPSARTATDRTGAPAWYPPLVGAWAAAFVVVPTLDEAAARLAGAGVLVLVLVGFFATFRAPGQPAPTATTASAYAAAVVACAVAAWFVAREVHPGAGAALALVLMTGLVAAYERRA